MSKNKVGRNEPCPCGSGKKFKNCCQSLDEGAGTDHFTRYSQAIASMKLKLDQEYKAEIKRIRKSALQSFLHYAVDNQLPVAHESLFSDWLWFDMTDNEGNTLGLDYLNQHGSFMPTAWQECLTALTSSYLSIYAPTGSGDGFVELRDIFSGAREQVILKEALEEDIRTRPFLLLGRLIAMSGGKVFSGMVLAAENNDEQEDYLVKHLQYLQALTNESDIIKLLKSHTDLLYGLFDHAYQKKHILINDIRILELPDQKTAVSLPARLDTCERLSFIHAIEDLRWYKAVDEQGYQRIACGEDYIVCFISSLDSLDSWQDILGDRFPGLREWTIVNTSFRRQPPSADLAPIWFKVMREQETERWLHTPHGELDNKTPQEQLAEDHGQEKVLAMLDLFAARLEEDHEGLDLVDYMRRRVLATERQKR